MNERDDKNSDFEPGYGPIDFVLGQGAEDERAQFEAGLAEDLELALEVADCTDLLEQFRTLQCEPTGRVPSRVWSRVRRRVELRSRPRPFGLVDAGAIVTVAAACLVGLLGLESLTLEEAEEPVVTADLAEFDPNPETAGATGVRPLAPPVLWPRSLPVASSGFRAGFERLSQIEVPTSFGLSMDARELLTRARHEASLRMESKTLRQRHRGLGLPNLASRTDRLSADLAKNLDAVLRLGVMSSTDATLSEIALSTRALIASGSTPNHGPHADVVSRAGQRLIHSVADVPVEDRIAVGSALVDLATVAGGEFAVAASTVAGDLILECESAAEEGGLVRPALLAWSVPHTELGEAGRLLRLAPAFGADSAGCFVTRLWILSHLFEREMQGQHSERPELLTAQLYGFGDLIERTSVDHRLRLWTTRSLFRRDPVAAQQLAWSRYPIRRGWTEFQQELPSLAVRDTPTELLEGAALLLTLCTNTAAPGVSTHLAAIEREKSDPIATLFFRP